MECIETPFINGCACTWKYECRSQCCTYDDICAEYHSCEEKKYENKIVLKWAVFGAIMFVLVILLYIICKCVKRRSERAKYIRNQ